MAPAKPTSKLSRPSPVFGSASASDIEPTIVTSSPSRIHTVPRPTTMSQWKRLQGSRSMRAGMSVVIRPVSTPDATSSSSCPDRDELFAAGAGQLFDARSGCAVRGPPLRVNGSIGPGTGSGAAPAADPAGERRVAAQHRQPVAPVAAALPERAAAVLDRQDLVAVGVDVGAALVVLGALLGDREVVADDRAVPLRPVLLRGREPGRVRPVHEPPGERAGVSRGEESAAAGEGVEVVELHRGVAVVGAAVGPPPTIRPAHAA